MQLSGLAVHPVTGEEIPGKIPVPCYKCLVCQDNRRNDWATRCELEARRSGSSFFITLTYEDSYLPSSGEVALSEFQSFVKQLRRKVPGEVRYFGCAEYGPRFSQRPHYHCVLFFQNRFDKEIVEAFVTASWSRGFVKVCQCTRNHYRYVAKYTMKWLNAAPQEGMKEPFAFMSRRPGIASDYFVNTNGFCMSTIPLESGHKTRVPRYGLSKLDPVEQLFIKRQKQEYLESLKSLPDTEVILRGKALEEKILRKSIQLYGEQKRKPSCGPLE